MSHFLVSYLMISLQINDFHGKNQGLGASVRAAFSDDVVLLPAWVNRSSAHPFCDASHTPMMIRPPFMTKTLLNQYRAPTSKTNCIIFLLESLVDVCSPYSGATRPPVPTRLDRRPRSAGGQRPCCLHRSAWHSMVWTQNTSSSLSTDINLWVRTAESVPALTVGYSIF